MTFDTESKKPKYPCMACGKMGLSEDNFFSSRNSPLWKNASHRVLICKNCIGEYFKELSKKYGESNALITMCGLLDIPFSLDMYVDMKEKGTFTLPMYIRNFNLVQNNANSTFVQSVINGSLARTYADTQAGKNESWSKEDKRISETCVSIIGYDPFPTDCYSDGERRFLYQDLSRYLDDDSVSKDAYKASQIIQLVINNFQIKKIDSSIAKTSADIEPDKIKQLNDLKKILVQSNTSIAKENEISVKNRSDKDAGHSTLTFLMRDLRERDIESAEANFYDQLRSEGTRWAIDMSTQSLLENTMFDENDKQEIFINQRNMISSLQKELDDEKEKNRLLLKRFGDKAVGGDNLG